MLGDMVKSRHPDSLRVPSPRRPALRLVSFWLRLHPLPLGVRPRPIGAFMRPRIPHWGGCNACPGLQFRPRDETATVRGGQLASCLCERLICHHDRLITTVVQCARNNLLDSGDADSLCQPITLDRHAGEVFPGDEIHSIVTSTSGVSDTPTRSSKLCRNEFFKLDTCHLIDSRHTRRQVFKVTSSLSFGLVAILLNRKPQEDQYRQDEAA
jgi:hypothetical protein